MFRYRVVRTSAVALAVYGCLGLIIGVVMLLVGTATFAQLGALQHTLDRERGSLVQSIRAMSVTVRDTAGATTDFQASIASGRSAADSASRLANDMAGTFVDLSANLNISIFGIQPLAGIAPQFTRSAEELQQLAIALGNTRDALGQNNADVQRIGKDLTQLQVQLDTVAGSLSQPGVLGLSTQELLPFQIAFYGMCLLVLLQSTFSLVAGVALFRLQRALGSDPLFPVGRSALPAATDGEPERMPVMREHAR